MHKNIIIYLLLLLCLASCSRPAHRYLIGVSQCSEDIWRDKLNSELRMGTYAHEGVQLLLTSADDSDERQVGQIDSLVNAGIDLLIVAPNQMATISPAIDRAYDSGVPVIVYERKTNSRKFTAYMGADNRLMGREMGEFVAAHLGGKGRVLEVMGLKGSSPAIERHEGFVEAIGRYPGITLVAELQGDWTEESGYEAMKHYLEESGTTEFDFVFGQNDRMAVGARRALLDSFSATNSQMSVSALPLFCGIDGLPGEGGGIDCVRDSILEASYIYPTHGDEVLELALTILEGKPFNQETPLHGALVTRQNANVLLLQAEETERQTAQLDRLHAMADTYFDRIGQQHVIISLALGVIALLLIAIALVYLYHRGQVNIRRERVLNNLWNMDNTADSPTIVSAVEASTSAENTKSEAAESVESGEQTDAKFSDASPFINRFREVVESSMNNSELSVEDLASDMNLSRVQLYRKVKAITGSSPVELLRTARLNRGYQLLLSTDKTVSEVAYAVGFSAPAYFTKCFKDEFGMVPGDVRGKA